MISLKLTEGEFIVLVFCESIKLASLGRQYREKQAPYVTGNFLLSFGVDRMKTKTPRSRLGFGELDLVSMRA